MNESKNKIKNEDKLLILPVLNTDEEFRMFDDGVFFIGTKEDFKYFDIVANIVISNDLI